MEIVKAEHDMLGYSVVQVPQLLGLCVHLNDEDLRHDGAVESMIRSSGLVHKLVTSGHRYISSRSAYACWVPCDIMSEKGIIAEYLLRSSSKMQPTCWAEWRRMVLRKSGISASTGYTCEGAGSCGYASADGCNEQPGPMT